MLGQTNYSGVELSYISAPIAQPAGTPSYTLGEAPVINAAPSGTISERTSLRTMRNLLAETPILEPVTPQTNLSDCIGLEIQERIKNIDPHWIQTIKEQDPLYWRNRITLEDGTIWSIPMKHWNPGDQILISYDWEGGEDVWDCEFQSYHRINILEFFNTTQNETARGSCWYIDRKAENIVRVSAFTDYYNTVILSNGVTLNLAVGKDNLPIFTKWKKMILYTIRD